MNRRHSQFSVERAAAAVCVFLLAAVACPAANAAEPLGRLFFTPEQRQALDRQRQLGVQEKTQIPVDPTLTINGIVTRSSGKRTVWVNGVAQDGRAGHSGVTIVSNPKSPGTVSIDLDGKHTTKATVGATVNRNTGESVDVLEGGRVRVHPTRSATR